MKRAKSKLAMGWLPDLPDHRDYSLAKKASKDVKLSDKEKKLQKILKTKPKAEPKTSNTTLQKWFSPVEDQGNIGSCTANAGVGLLEYFQNRTKGRYINASRLFLYKTTRNLMGEAGDTGAFLRTTMQSMALFGVPPEDYWPYDEEKFDEEPTSFCYSFAQNYQALTYYRLDPPGTDADELLTTIKEYIDGGLPAMFGFSVYSSIDHASVAETGEIPFPADSERQEGGHAIVALGYDDNKVIKHPYDSSRSSKGAIFIRNSWGTEWGQDGYGWLPYDYITNYLAVDWWSLVDNEWVDLELFSD